MRSMIAKMNCKCHAVILAGGKGSRMNSDLPKQFCRVKGRPIFLQTIQKFVRVKLIHTIVVVTPEEEEGCKAKIKKLLGPLEDMFEKKLFVTTGGCSRNRSILAGLTLLKKELICDNGSWEKDTVVIHDGVRPFVTCKEINDVADAAKLSQAAGLVKPIMGSSVKIDCGGNWICTLDRQSHVMGESPQAFGFSTILECLTKSTPQELDHATDCMQLLSKTDVLPKVVFGDSCNLKITYETDLCTARGLSLGEETLICSLQSHLSSTVSKISSDLSIAVFNVERPLSFLFFVSILLLVIDDESTDFAANSSFNKVLMYLKEDFFPKLPNIATVILIMSVTGDFVKEEFTKMSDHLHSLGISCHLILMSSCFSSLGRLKRTLPFLADDEALPFGQILRL